MQAGIHVYVGGSWIVRIVLEICFLFFSWLTFSLENIYKELSTDIDGFVHPGHGDLSGWAKQGKPPTWLLDVFWMDFSTVFPCPALLAYVYKRTQGAPGWLSRLSGRLRLRS